MEKKKIKAKVRKKKVKKPCCYGCDAVCSRCGAFNRCQDLDCLGCKFSEKCYESPIVTHQMKTLLNLSPLEQGETVERKKVKFDFGFFDEIAGVDQAEFIRRVDDDD